MKERYYKIRAKARYYSIEFFIHFVLSVHDEGAKEINRYMFKIALNDKHLNDIYENNKTR